MSRQELKQLEQSGTLRTWDIVQDTVACAYCKQPYELKVPEKPKDVCEPRQVIMFFGFVYLSMTCSVVGREYGKNHPAVLHATRVVRNLYGSNREFRCKMNGISDKLGIDQERLKGMMVERKYARYIV